jgi:hypothetical protein
VPQAAQFLDNCKLSTTQKVRKFPRNFIEIFLAELMLHEEKLDSITKELTEMRSSSDKFKSQKQKFQLKSHETEILQQRLAQNPHHQVNSLFLNFSQLFRYSKKLRKSKLNLKKKPRVSIPQRNAKKRFAFHSLPLITYKGPQRC